MKYSRYNNFVKFLQDDLAMSKDTLAIVKKTWEKNIEPIPMVLWQYGLVTLEELDRIYDWLDAA